MAITTAGSATWSLVTVLLTVLTLTPFRLGSAEVRSGLPPSWKTIAGWSIRTTYDSNVFLQDQAPGPAVAGAFAAGHDSLVSTVALTATLTGRVAENFAVTASYAPEANVFHSARSEDHQVHRFGLSFTGESGATTWSLHQGATRIAGGAAGPVFGGPGGATALGGIPLRERRDALYGRSQFRLTWTSGAWFVRPVAALYCHDFLTEQSRRPGYLNYVDRQEWSAGADFGRMVAPKTRLFAGARRGRQDQFRLHGVDSPFDSTYSRWLVGLEGAPATWAQCSVATGPEVHRFPAPTPAGFNRDKTYWWIDATTTLAAGPRDTCTISVRRFVQPAFSSVCVYEDITYDFTWRRRVDARFTLAAGFKAYGGDWPGPVTREDWVFTPSMQIHYAPDTRRAVDLAWSFDRAESRLPLTGGREFRRHSVALTYKVSL